MLLAKHAIKNKLWKHLNPKLWCLHHRNMNWGFESCWYSTTWWEKIRYLLPVVSPSLSYGLNVWFPVRNLSYHPKSTEFSLSLCAEATDKGESVSSLRLDIFYFWSAEKQECFVMCWGLLLCCRAWHFFFSEDAWLIFGNGPRGCRCCTGKGRGFL